jgi:methylglutaconyl-CoA hydratase
MADVVHLVSEGGVATITLDSPENRNALSRVLLEQLDASLREARDDDATRVIVLTHTGNTFCAGADLKDPPAPGSQFSLPNVLNLIWTSPKPVVSRIDGHVRAGGTGLAAACDLAIASPNSTFAINEVRIGVAPSVISLVVVPRVGHTRALELFLGGETFDATRAAEVGLVTAAVDDVDAEVGERVRQLLLGAPNALAITKRLLRPTELDFSELERLSVETFASDEAHEGIAAFREKRPPRWAAD